MRFDNYHGGDIGTDAASALHGIQENVLYKIPEVGKVLKFVGDNAENIVNTVFGIKAKTLDSAKKAEAGIDIFHDENYIGPDDPRYATIEAQGVTDEDQELYSKSSAIIIKYHLTGGP